MSNDIKNEDYIDSKYPIDIEKYNNSYKDKYNEVINHLNLKFEQIMTIQYMFHMSCDSSILFQQDRFELFLNKEMSIDKLIKKCDIKHGKYSVIFCEYVSTARHICDNFRKMGYTSYIIYDEDRDNINEYCVFVNQFLYMNEDFIYCMKPKFFMKKIDF